MSPFGARMRRWRQTRRISQLELANLAGSTARHMSFLETGRSRPSRDMVLRLAEALDVPLAERNQLLGLAGLPPIYPDRSIDARELAPYRKAIDRLLAAHEPYPALVFDRCATVVATNQACTRLFGLDLVGMNLIERYVTDPDARDAIVNWPQVARSSLGRLRRQLETDPLDTYLAHLVEQAAALVAGLPPPDGDADDGLVTCPWFRVDGTVIRMMVLTARFDEPVDVALDGLRIELLYPLDDTAAAFFTRPGARLGR